MKADYISPTSFSVANDQVDAFVTLRRLLFNFGGEEVAHGTVKSSTYGDAKTTVVIRESVLTSSLLGVKYSVVKPGDTGNEPPDWKQGAELPVPPNPKAGDFFFKTDDGHIYVYND